MLFRSDPLLCVGSAGKMPPKRLLPKPKLSGKPLPKCEVLGKASSSLLGQMRELTEANARRMGESLDALLAKDYPMLKSIVPVVSRITVAAHNGAKTRSETIRFHYKGTVSKGGIQKEVIAYCDTNGRIKQVLESK